MWQCSQAVMLSLKTVSWLKTVLRQFSRCLGLGFGLAVSVLVFTATIAKAQLTSTMPPPHKKLAIQQYKRSTTSNSQSTESLLPEATLAKYIAAISHEDQTNVFASQEYAVIRPLFYRLLSVPASSAPVELFFTGRRYYETTWCQDGRCDARIVNVFALQW